MGLGSESSAFTILSASPPSMMIKPSVVKSAISTQVTFTWTAPESNGDSITAYKLLILNSAALFLEAPLLCNGALQSVVSALSCSISMNDIVSTFGLAINSQIIAKIQAQNTKGLSVISDQSTNDVTVSTAPTISPTFFLHRLQALSSVGQQ
jgi:hypothetical protein